MAVRLCLREHQVLGSTTKCYTQSVRGAARTRTTPRKISAQAAVLEKPRKSRLLRGAGKTLLVRATAKNNGRRADSGRRPEEVYSG